MKVYYLGPDSSFSHQFAVKYFSGQDVKLEAVESLSLIPDCLLGSDAQAVMAIENSTTSNVALTVEAVINNRLHIMGEGYLKINLHLCAARGTTPDKIRHIHGHPMALAQASKFIKDRQLTKHEHSSNSAAQRFVITQNDPTNASVCGDLLYDEKSSEILCRDITNYSNNKTRFLVLQAKSCVPALGEKTTVLFTARHEPGSLAKVLNFIAALGLNLTKIESRPIPGTDWEYLFWIDVEGNNAGLDKLISGFGGVVMSYDVLGRYSRGAEFSA